MPARLKHTLITLSFLFLILLSPSFAFAQSTSTITAIPPRKEFEIAPNQSQTIQLKLRNDSDTLYYYHVEVTDFIVSGLNGTPVPVTADTSGRWALSSWVTTPNLIPVDPNSTQPVNITVTAPPDALPGGHYAMITYRPNPNLARGELQDTGAQIGQRAGTLLYATVPGDITQDALIKQFTAPQFTEYGPVDFYLQIENLSDVHIQPTGTITIKDMFGKKIDTLKLEMENIFPYASRQLTTQWEKKLGYGRYQADLELAYGSQGDLLTASIYFWLFPIRIVIYTLMLLLSIASLILIFRHRHIKHEKELEEEVKHLKDQMKDSSKQTDQ